MYDLLFITMKVKQMNIFQNILEHNLRQLLSNSCVSTVYELQDVTGSQQILFN